MYFHLGTLGVFDTTSPKDFVKSFATLLISYSTSHIEDEEPANPIDRAILVSQLQKAFTDLRKSVTREAIAYLDRTAPDDLDLRKSHALYNGMEIGISHKVDPSYPNIRDYDQRPDDLPEDITWQSLSSMQATHRYYQSIADAYKQLIDARIETIVSHHPNQKCVEAIQEAFVVTVPKADSQLPEL